MRRCSNPTSPDGGGCVICTQAPTVRHHHGSSKTYKTFFHRAIQAQEFHSEFRDMQTSYTLFLLPLFALATVRAASNCQFYHFKIGEVNATVISDGLTTLEIGSSFPDIHPDAVKRVAAANFRSEDTLMLFSNPLHLDMGTRKVMVDVGSADKFAPTFGKLLENMEAAGLDPEEVDDVLLTHANLDHSAGLVTPGGDLAFPNAKVHLSRDELEFWKDAKLKDMPKHFSGGFKELLLGVAQEVLEAVSEKIEVFELGDEVLPGITSRDAPGHTPGHTAFIIESGDDSLVHSGDVLPWELFSIEHPDWGWDIDFDIPTGVSARYSLLEELAESGMMFLSYHNDFPGLGHIVRQGHLYALKQPKYQF